MTKSHTECAGEGRDPFLAAVEKLTATVDPDQREQAWRELETLLLHWAREHMYRC
jgi:hypothetical protein